MHIAILTFQGFNELDSIVALSILNRVKRADWRVTLCGPESPVTSMNGVNVNRQLRVAHAASAAAIGSTNRLLLQNEDDTVQRNSGRRGCAHWNQEPMKHSAIKKAALRKPLVKAAYEALDSEFQSLQRANYDFSKSKRNPFVAAKGKTRITIHIDDVVLKEFRSRAEKAGSGYQTMMNEALKAFLADTDSQPVTEAMLRRVIREELPNASRPSKRSATRTKIRAT
jgi:uncharacterized protein (DUF4415 family)